MKCCVTMMCTLSYRWLCWKICLLIFFPLIFLTLLAIMSHFVWNSQNNVYHSTECVTQEMRGHGTGDFTASADNSGTTGLCLYFIIHATLLELKCMYFRLYIKIQHTCIFKNISFHVLLTKLTPWNACVVVAVFQQLPWLIWPWTL